MLPSCVPLERPCKISTPWTNRRVETNEPPPPQCRGVLTALRSYKYKCQAIGLGCLTSFQSHSVFILLLLTFSQMRSVLDFYRLAYTCLIVELDPASESICTFPTFTFLFVLIQLNDNEVFYLRSIAPIKFTMGGILTIKVL